MIGFALVYALQLAGVFQYMVRLSAQVETQMTSVERILHYTTLSPEPGSAINASTKSLEDKDKKWPYEGAIEMQGLTARYREDLPIVLHDVSISVPPGSKVGVVGRTGAGKSSVMATIFQLNEMMSGSIILDNKTVQETGLEEWRRAFALIPQEPHLFSGTVRFNVDPFTEYTDAEVMSYKITFILFFALLLAA